MKEIWYWEYQVKIWDDIDEQEEIRSGVVASEGGFAGAMSEIEAYYGRDIIEVQLLKAIMDGVLEFQELKYDERP